MDLSSDDDINCSSDSDEECPDDLSLLDSEELEEFFDKFQLLSDIEANGGLSSIKDPTKGDLIDIFRLNPNVYGTDSHANPQKRFRNIYDHWRKNPESYSKFLNKITNSFGWVLEPSPRPSNPPSSSAKKAATKTTPTTPPLDRAKESTPIKPTKIKMSSLPKHSDCRKYQNSVAIGAFWITSPNHLVVAFAFRHRCCPWHV